jgi:hypothetical protein
MDPTANLTEQINLADEMLRGTSVPSSQDAFRLAELVTTLHEWITSGGFLPNQWNKEIH